MAKQAELKELLLLVDQEKGKRKACVEESDSDKTYDPLYDDLGDDEGEDEDARSTSEPEVPAISRATHGSEPAKVRSKHTRQSGSPPPLKDGRTRFLGKERTPAKKSSRQKKHYEASESSSSDEAALLSEKKPGKGKIMMARRALGRISASPFASSEFENF